jgi:hypothetical protein
MKRQPKLTKRERKAQNPRPAQGPGGGTPSGHGHIHCVACGKHLDPGDFEAPAVATTITCDHGSVFASCVRCMAKSTALVQEHDRTGQPVKAAGAWH